MFKSKFNKIKSKIMNFYYYLGNNCFLPVNDLEKISFDKKIIFYSVIWGHHFDSYFSFTLPSILHKSNYDELLKENFELTFFIYTIDSENEIKSKYKDFLKKYNYIEIQFIELKSISELKPRKIAGKAIVDVLKKCIDEKSLLFVAPPDMIFGNYSIFNCVKSSYKTKKPFAAAHPRVSYEILNSIKKSHNNGISNSDLVSLAMRHPHYNLKFADSSLKLNTTHAGLSYSRISERLYTVISNMPSIFLAFPLIKDYEYFKDVDDFNMWDRGWLEMLVKENRFNVCGSSDLFFCTELTGDSVSEQQKLKNIDKQLNSIENRVCAMYSAIWRAK